MTNVKTSVKQTTMTRAKTTSPAPSRRGLIPARLELEDGATYEGESFGHRASVGGEVVFTTGMVGYPETLTDPSYYGQVIVCTYPLVGNYGVAEEIQQPSSAAPDQELGDHFESWKIHARGIVVADYSTRYSHWDAAQSLGQWLESEGVAGISGIDTRHLTMRLREKGSMLGRIVIDDKSVDYYDPNHLSLGAEVSIAEPTLYGKGNPQGRVALVDCGVKYNIVRCLLDRGLEVLRVPWNYPISDQLAGDRCAGVMLSNGPGDPVFFERTVDEVKRLVEQDALVMGVCMGNQLLSLAIGAKTFKLKYGHRGQNQPVLEVGTNRGFVTSQNHGFAVDTESLPTGWSPWFENLNDGTNEGIRSASGRQRSVQFHPEAAPGPVDAAYLFDEFVKNVEGEKAR